MYTEIPLSLAVMFILGGLFVLAKSADIFVDGAATVAKYFGVPSFIVGMVIIGFGTSAPELCVSILSASAGHSSLSFGNAFGSCIFNIAGILGLVALVRPIAISKSAVWFGSPMLIVITLIQYFFVQSGGYSRMEGILTFALFCVILPIYCLYEKKDSQVESFSANEKNGVSIVKHFVMLVLGLVFLVGSSHILVWGCVDVARALNISELLIGLTVVAIGTSLPELASAIAAARKNEHELVVGNIIGSNLFNTLAVVGIAGAIQPFEHLSKYAVSRDVPVCVLVSVVLILVGINWKAPKKSGVITRIEGFCFVVFFMAYLAVMAYQELTLVK
jgi:cation:H+ antiporter